MARQLKSRLCTQSRTSAGTSPSSTSPPIVENLAAEWRQLGTAVDDVGPAARSEIDDSAVVIDHCRQLVIGDGPDPGR